MANIFEFLSKDGNITPEKARKSRQMPFHDKTAYVWMGMLPLKKRVNRDKCSFATKQRMFGVFAIDDPGSPVPPLYATLVTGALDYPKYPTIWQPLSDYPTIPTIGRPPNCRELSSSRRDQAVSSPACARLNIKTAEIEIATITTTMIMRFC